MKRQTKSLAEGKGKPGIQGTTVLAVLLFIFLATLPFYMPMFRVSLFGKYMCFAIVALGLDMIWGYTGILSLGHGVYFSLGAYCMAMYLKLEASGGALPDFMSWSGLMELPRFWKPLQNPVFAVTMALLVPVALDEANQALADSVTTVETEDLDASAAYALLSAVFAGQQE